MREENKCKGNMIMNSVTKSYATLRRQWHKLYLVSRRTHLAESWLQVNPLDIGSSEIRLGQALDLVGASN